MAWVKLDDQFFTHPKVLDRSKDAKLLYMAGLTYAASNLTDGYLSSAALRLSAAMVDADVSVADELVAAGLWLAVPNGYQIHDYLEYNPAAEEVKQQRAENARRQAEWRERHKTSGATNEESNGATHTVTNSVTNTCPVPLPVPTLTPVPNPVETTVERVRAPAPPTSKSPSPIAFEIAEVLIQAPWVGDDLEIVARKVDESAAKATWFVMARDGPMLSLQFTNCEAYRKKPPANWYAAWLNWLKKERDRSPPNGLSPPTPVHDVSIIDNVARELGIGRYRQ